ncbi:hypothetical protein DFJ73DRAFT_795129 [Zopfochytrium polystomum]|nr:hypothetical protein DFJ73DRAFT_795129 [Zopfochytrium polystomum]
MRVFRLSAVAALILAVETAVVLVASSNDSLNTPSDIVHPNTAVQLYERGINGGASVRVAIITAGAVVVGGLCVGTGGIGCVIAAITWFFTTLWAAKTPDNQVQYIGNARRRDGQGLVDSHTYWTLSDPHLSIVNVTKANDVNVYHFEHTTLNLTGRFVKNVVTNSSLLVATSNAAQLELAGSWIGDQVAQCPGTSSDDVNGAASAVANYLQSNQASEVCMKVISGGCNLGTSRVKIASTSSGFNLPSETEGGCDNLSFTTVYNSPGDPCGDALLAKETSLQLQCQQRLLFWAAWTLVRSHRLKC